ncbi:MAG: ThiF family adenylyltransferase [Bdellovibrio sp.]|nr:ThiF family adenylyltransferase [Bdellovibrio sp.]
MIQAVHTLKSSDPVSFYAELTRRNFHFVSEDLQKKVAKVRVLIAGCGSTGGACIESLARVGVQHFALADNGSYELNNMNRQHVRLENLGENKAAFHAKEIRSINPYVEVLVSEEGITPQNVDRFVEWADFVFDAVDVTTQSGIKAKILLHQKCHSYKKPVLSGLDLGYLQWGCSYDYRGGHLAILNGREHAALAAKNPLAAIFALYPFSIVPNDCVSLLIDMFEQKIDFAPQMGCTSDALSAVIVPALLKFAGTGELISGWHLDLSSYRYTRLERLVSWLKSIPLRFKLRGYVRRLS